MRSLGVRHGARPRPKHPPILSFSRKPNNNNSDRDGNRKKLHHDSVLSAAGSTMADARLGPSLAAKRSSTSTQARSTAASSSQSTRDFATAAPKGDNGFFGARGEGLVGSRSVTR